MKWPVHLGTVKDDWAGPISILRLADGSYVIRKGAKGRGEEIYRGCLAGAGGFIIGWLDPEMFAPPVDARLIPCKGNPY